MELKIFTFLTLLTLSQYYTLSHQRIRLASPHPSSTPNLAGVHTRTNPHSKGTPIIILPYLFSSHNYLIIPNHTTLTLQNQTPINN
jgi:hypothetical protein